MSFSWEFPYPSRRMPVLARNAIATSQPLATQAGMQMLLKGGNAVDAALAAAITLTLVEPISNGIGSDAFAIVWEGQHLHGLNSTGRSPAAWSPERFAGREKMPLRGWDTVTVPGAVHAWITLSERFGKLPFADLFAPAIRYARDGFPVSPIIAEGWASAPRVFKDFPEFAEVFLPGGRAPAAGERFRSEGHARTLEKIAATSGEAFYRGELAEKIAAHAKATGGAMTVEDLAAHRPDWVAPISVEYHGVRLHELPPNGQGIAALIALGILRHHDLREHPVDSADSVHAQIEAMKLAFAEAHHHVADPASMAVAPQELLDEGFLAARAREIRMDRAGFPKSALPREKGTVYLTAADESGMMISFIQSNFHGFGSGIVIPGTGISLQNRGHAFSLEPGHPNRVAGRKRPYHTIIPAFVTRDGHPLMSFGVMGGHMQPQGHVQMMVRIFDYEQNPQAASDAARWYVHEDGRISLETGFDAAVAEELRQRGHPVTTGVGPDIFGGGQYIYRLEHGYCAASDPRKDGHAAGF